MTAASATSVWAVGDDLDTFNDPKPLIMHWDGKSWSRVASGAPQDTVLWDMTVLTGTDAWAVGAHTDGRPTLGGTGASSVILHWNGKAWA